MTPTSTRSRRDLCPGVLRPWAADDGALVRVRLVGGRVPAASLAGLAAVARTHGDGRLHLTGRANLQLRALPWSDPTTGALPDEVVAAVEATGLLPSRSHELGRNVMVSPFSGLAGGRADLRPVADELDELLRADPALADLPGRFLQVLDDGRGDLVDRGTDLGLVALDERTGQLRVGDAWGPVVTLTEAPRLLVDLAARFLAVRGTGPTAPWHVEELDAPLHPAGPRDPRVPAASERAAYGPQSGGDHVAVPDGVLDADLVDRLVAPGRELVVTPWHGVVVPAESGREVVA
ncbi:nitrite reductase [Nocardioides aurantiacus]|uniref:Precorrin-3B synthase n=1 Tax=Nocardioides aurantiacus TaxID=86796 RepID=A0A3N2CRY7_9ACTN|nr:nitrite reductase [Nocardioides aurantiacus]ROR90289.1 precorrin-3B synthase [Nocardioides aurantiacus]